MNQKILSDGLKHLCKDQKMNNLIEKFDRPNYIQDMDYFNALSKTIIYQQLSGKAAKTIYNRYLNLFNNQYPKSNDIINIGMQSIRNVGISQKKSEYIFSLANYFSQKGVNINFKLLSDIEVSNELLQLKGIGQWTVDMFLMFSLYRTDILPIGDLGIQKGIKMLFNIKNLPSKKYMLKISKPWQPYRSIACWYLWRIVDDEETW